MSRLHFRCDVCEDSQKGCYHCRPKRKKGRPRKDDPERRTVMLTVPVAVHTAMTMRAAAGGQSLSSWVRSCLSEALGVPDTTERWEPQRAKAEEALRRERWAELQVMLLGPAPVSLEELNAAKARVLEALPPARE